METKVDISVLLWGKKKEIYFIFLTACRSLTFSTDMSPFHHSLNPGSVRVLRAQDLTHFWPFRLSEPPYTSWNNPQTIKKSQEPDSALMAPRVRRARRSRPYPSSKTENLASRSCT